MGLKRNTRWARAKAASRLGVKRIHCKFEPRRVARLLEAKRRTELLSPEPKPAVIVPNAVMESRRFVRESGQHAVVPVPRKIKEFSGRSVARGNVGTFGESLREKLLDAVEPLWFAKLERDERHTDASAIVRVILDRQRARRTRRVVATKIAPVIVHPLYKEIADRLPPASEAITVAVGPRVVQAAYAERDIRNLLLFKGSLSLQKARSMFVFLSACMDAGLDDIGSIIGASQTVTVAGRYETGKGAGCIKYTKTVSEMAHISGLHRPLENLALYGFLARIRQTPSVWPLAPHIREWASDVKGQLKMKLTTVPLIAKCRTRRAWRKLPERVEVYPYIVGPATDEHALIMRVHAAVPRGLPPEVRADVCQELLVDILSGDILESHLDDPESLRELTKAKLKDIRGKRVFSLDEPLRTNKPRFHGDRLSTRADLLPTDAPHW